MKEYIEREAARAELIINDELYAADIVKAIPAADVRPVVLCKDCKYCRKEDEFEYWCDGFCSPARLVRKDDYCSHGSKCK